jgi:multidrug resistance efflux pump
LATYSNFRVPVTFARSCASSSRRIPASTAAVRAGFLTSVWSTVMLRASTDVARATPDASRMLPRTAGSVSVVSLALSALSA